MKLLGNCKIKSKIFRKEIVARFRRRAKFCQLRFLFEIDPLGASTY